MAVRLCIRDGLAWVGGGLGRRRPGAGVEQLPSIRPVSGACVERLPRGARPGTEGAGPLEGRVGRTCADARPRTGRNLAHTGLTWLVVEGGRYWWPGAGSNRRPSDFQSDARTN